MKARYLLLIFIFTLAFAVHAGKVTTDARTGLDFATIPAGEFSMGTSNLDAVVAEMPKPDRSMVQDETPAHTVSISRAFDMSITEVTQRAWLAVMNSRPGPDSHWQHTDWQQLPVVSVNWQQVQQFIDRLNAASSEFRYRLPTEAEWEYAARAGDNGIRPSDTLDLGEHAWYIHTSNDEVQPVAQLMPNAWGLYDTLGNAWEWVNDRYAADSYQRSSALDPEGPATGNKRVRRGGSYHCQPNMVRYAYRAADTADTAYSVTGFRLVREKR